MTKITSITNLYHLVKDFLNRTNLTLEETKSVLEEVNEGYYKRVLAEVERNNKLSKHAKQVRSERDRLRLEVYRLKNKRKVSDDSTNK